MAQEIYPTVGIIGSSTANGWEASTPMRLADPADPHQWTLTVFLTEGALKFRANDAWGDDWGGTFPTGTATYKGSDFLIPAASYYTISFNDASGAYHFEAFAPASYSTIGLVGDATANGWNGSIPLVQDARDPHSWTIENITLSAGEVKFRANNTWDVSWGGSSFPKGTAYTWENNLSVQAGEYHVSFNDVTGEYYFRNLNPSVYESVGLVGSSTEGGWENSTPMQAVAGDPNSWTLTTYLQAGEVKFRVNNSWDINWGGSQFPSGTAVFNAGNITVPQAGYYTISFNDSSLSYNFIKLNPPTYATVGIVGTATPSGWDVSTPMLRGEDGHTWTLSEIELTSGELKFRANDAWTINWGATAFPNGTGTQDGPNIPVPGGIYNISLNDFTGEYNFELTGTVSGGIVSLDPALPTADEPVTIIYDASQGVSALQGAEKVYMHSGVVLSGPEGSEWNKVVGNWGSDDGIGEMTPVEGETDKWQITLPSIREYYSVEAGVPVFRLGMVFRSADGSSDGKSESGGDIFVAVDPGDFVRFTEPVSEELFGMIGDQITLAAEASGIASSIKMEIDAGNGFVTVSEIADSQSISHNYSLNSSGQLLVRVTAVLDGTPVVAEKSLSLHLRQENTIAELPEGVHNGINYHPTDPTKATLVLLAPEKEFVYAVGDFNSWQISDAYQMNQTPDGESFWIELTGLEAKREYVYQYWVEGALKIGDPYAHKVADPFRCLSGSGGLRQDRIRDSHGAADGSGSIPVELSGGGWGKAPE